ncbi:MAG: hypothetical protein K0S20_606 [Patescibacteria group bacterium]|nr:hypothetical protein [Patescibacteria group bacterium]
MASLHLVLDPPSSLNRKRPAINCRSFSGVTDGDRTHDHLSHNQVRYHCATVTIKLTPLQYQILPFRERAQVKAPIKTKNQPLGPEYRWSG